MLKMMLALAMQDDAGAREADAAVGVFGAMIFLVFFAVWAVLMLVTFVSAWKIFVKAGRPGWAAIVPIYNIMMMIEMSGKPGWWIFLFFIPGVNFVVGFIVMNAIAERFGKGPGFALGMLLLPFVFFPILAFGNARYQG